MGPADEVTSHLYSFGIRGKQFQYVEGKLPEGFPFHGRLTDHDVRNLQARGAEVLVLESHYTAEDLKQAREDCRGESGKSPNQADGKVAPAQNPDQASVKVTSAQTATPVSTPTAVSNSNVAAAPPPSSQTIVPAAQAQGSSTGSVLTINSAPVGADIFVDDDFVGNTPSTIRVPLGRHAITVRKPGFQDWLRNVNFSGGSITLNAELDHGSNEPQTASTSAMPATNSSPKPIGWIGIHAQNSGDVAVVTNVTAEGPGAKAGIQVGDIIVALGRLIKGKDFESAVAALKPRTQVSVNYARGSASREVQITVGSQN
jgi:PEGA domain/PDZ domain